MKLFLCVPLCAVLAAVVTLHDHSWLASVETAALLLVLMALGFMLLVSDMRDARRSRISR